LSQSPIAIPIVDPETPTPAPQTRSPITRRGLSRASSRINFAITSHKYSPTPIDRHDVPEHAAMDMDVQIAGDIMESYSEISGDVGLDKSSSDSHRKVAILLAIPIDITTAILSCWPPLLSQSLSPFFLQQLQAPDTPSALYIPGVWPSSPNQGDGIAAAPPAGPLFSALVTWAASVIDLPARLVQCFFRREKLFVQVLLSLLLSYTFGSSLVGKRKVQFPKLTVG
jgi:hypothetical protein